MVYEHWRRLLRAALAMSATMALGGSLAGGAAAASKASSITPPTTTGVTRYATVRQICPAARRGDASCLALALVPARAGAPGARSYLRSAGAVSSGPAGGLTPADLASAYGYTPTLGGSGQTVAIVDAFDDPKLEEDLAGFDAHYGLAACTTADGCFEKVNQEGNPAPLPKADKVGWSVEMSLDVEAVHSVCPACKILLVEANSESLADLASAVDESVALGARQVSNSYGALESEMGSAEQAAYQHPGTVIAAAAGDSGYLNWDKLAETFVAPEVPDAPASLPAVVAVGGTSLKLTSSGTRRSETVWNDSGRPSRESEFKMFAGTGGGCSTLFMAPAWQQSVAGWSSTGCGTSRLDNDISAVADPYTGFDIYDTYVYAEGFSPGWLTIGGTSLSSPLITALFALAGGAHEAAYPAATLYGHLGQTSALYDVTAGGNGYCDGEANGPCGEPGVNETLGNVDCQGTTACDAATGFDGPSGVGTPKGLTAFGGPSQRPPTVVTKAATSVGVSAAQLNATVNPSGEPVTACTFEYGPTTAYGHSQSCSSLPGSGRTAVAISASVAGLVARTVYHFRILATNASGTGDGKDRTLTTK
jgi:hypothetical protein